LAACLRSIGLGQLLRAARYELTGFFRRLLPTILASALATLGGVVSGGALALVAAGYSYMVASGLPEGGIERVVAVVTIAVLTGRLSELNREVAQSRRQYVSLVEKGPAVTYLWSARRQLIFISSNVEALTGHTVAEWRAHFTSLLEDIVVAEDRQAMGAAMESLQRDDVPMRLTINIRRPDGTKAWLDHNADCVSRADGDCLVQGTLIDVTARYLVAESTRTGELARAQSQAKTRFLATMSHELRTPLNSILGYAQLLQQRSPSMGERDARYVENILSSGENMLRLLNDSLDLAKVEAGQLELVPERFALGNAIAEAMETIEPLAARKGLKLDCERSLTPLTIHADRRRLHQILLNLLTNAVKFTNTGSVVVNYELEGEAAVIRIADSGIGIPASALSGVFEEYSQLGSPDVPGGGTGLGLSVSRRLARAMGGELTVASRLGRGSTFTLVLPLKAPASVTAPQYDVEPSAS
jgi:PAS domain S-box-containing protein